MAFKFLTNYISKIASQGWRNNVDWPTDPVDESAARDRLQIQHDQTRDYINDYLNYAVDAGAANAYVVTLDPAPTTYPLMIQFKAANANTGASTINPNGLGAKAIKKNVSEDLEAGAIKAGGISYLVYDGTNYQLVTRHNIETLIANSVSNIQGFSSDLAAWYGNTKLIAMFQTDETWTSSAGTQSADATNVKLGSQSIKITENDAVGGTLYSARTGLTLDLSKLNNGEVSPTSDYIYLVAYISDVTKVTNVFAYFITSVGNNYLVLKNSGLITGWNFIAIQKSAASITGAPNWANITEINVGWVSVATAQNAYVSFQLIQLIKKDPQAAYPNPHQRNGTTDFAINSGEWFIGIENNVVTLRPLNPQVNDLLVGTKSYSDFTESLKMIAKGAGSIYRLCWYKNAANYIDLYVVGNVIHFRQVVNSTVTDYTASGNIAIGDAIRLKMVKRESSVQAYVYINDKAPVILSMTTILTGAGYLAVYGIAGASVYIYNASITTTEHAYHADVAEAINAPHNAWTPTLTWGTATPTISSSVFRFQQTGNRVKGTTKIVCSNGMGATSLTISLPTPITNRGNTTVCYAQEKVNATWSDPRAYIDDSGSTISLRSFSTMTSGQASELEVFFDYEN